MAIEIIRTRLQVAKKDRVGDDAGVAEFGPDVAKRAPIDRTQQVDTVGKKAQRFMRESAIVRALHFGYGVGEVPQVHFPNAEHFKDQPFNEEHWEEFGNMESEKRRIDFMLQVHGQRRGFPESFNNLTAYVVSDKDPLQRWGEIAHHVAESAQTTYEQVKAQMLANKREDEAATRKGYKGGNGYKYEAFQSDPVLYSTTSEGVSGEIKLWNKAVAQITRELQQGDDRNLGNFLDLYAHIKDPITPITATLPEQVTIFKDLFAQAKIRLAKLGVRTIDSEQGANLITQLALESSFLALPAAKDVFYFRGDAYQHNLPYIHVDLKDLPRGEFTEPMNEKKDGIGVIPRIREILADADHYGEVMLTPLTVSYFQKPGETDPSIFLVDGNNRATALMVMQYLYDSHVPFDGRTDGAAITRFMDQHQLHPGWEREIVLTLNTLTEYQFNEIVGDSKRLKKVVSARVPALLVQEPNFHTIDVPPSEKHPEDNPESRIYLLQPMHQAIYNEDNGHSMAIPPKMQTHGRALGNDFVISARAERRVTFGRERYRVVPTQSQGEPVFDIRWSPFHNQYIPEEG